MFQKDVRVDRERIANSAAEPPSTAWPDAPESWPDVIGMPGRIKSESLAGCYRNAHEIESSSDWPTMEDKDD